MLGCDVQRRANLRSVVRPDTKRYECTAIAQYGFLDFFIQLAHELVSQNQIQPKLPALRKNGADYPGTERLKLVDVEVVRHAHLFGCLLDGVDDDSTDERGRFVAQAA